jgi:hypothetical protein
MASTKLVPRHSRVAENYAPFRADLSFSPAANSAALPKTLAQSARRAFRRAGDDGVDHRGGRVVPASYAVGFPGAYTSRSSSLFFTQERT